MTRKDLAYATRARILESAQARFEALGYEATTIRSIADGAACSTGAIFAHFDGKADLYREVYGHGVISPEVARGLYLAWRERFPAVYEAWIEAVENG